MVALATDVQDLRGEAGGVVLSTKDMDLRWRWLVNCAGLAAPDVVRPLLPNAPRARYAVGHYYAYSGPAPFSRLVYPVPEPGGLGIHVTRDLAGQIKFGPDVVWREVIDYTFPADEAALRSKFAAAIGSYFPGLQADRLHPSYTGIRPKIVAPGEAAADFAIAGPQQHGVPGLVNLMGIESPGLTASLAIADHVVGLLRA